MTSTLIESIARHLPPAASQLNLLDINGECGEYLSQFRHDLAVTRAPGYVRDWPDFDDNSFDAITALDYVLNEAFLQKALHLLRPGGRLIVVQSTGQVSDLPGKTLEKAGYVRILVEQASESVGGVLIRGEKVHHTMDTMQRIQSVAGHDADQLDLTTYKGRYVHLLIQQTPNKPAWRLKTDEKIMWQAAALRQGGEEILLAFSSLPKAVSFMQPAVLGGRIHDINKVGKFDKRVAAKWQRNLLLNPTMDVLENGEIVMLLVDHTQAEAPDE